MTDTTSTFAARVRPVAIALALAFCLVAGSTPRLVGDGGEYLAMALNLASFHGPAMSARDIPRIQQLIGEVDPTLENWDIQQAAIPGKDLRRDFLHFWFYPLLAVPALWITQALGVTPIAAFAALNLTLMAAALWLAIPRIGSPACVLLFAGPIVWWLDKPHTEVFTFALLTIAFVLVRDRPGWSMLASGMASTQNPPIAILIGLVFLSQAISRPAWLRNRRFLLMTCASLVLAGLQPAYTYIRHGMPTLLLVANPTRVPSLAEVLAVPFDPEIGLVANFPALAIVATLAAGLVLLKKPRALWSIDALVAYAAAAGFLFAVSQAINVHHGGTPGMSRYVIWLIPLTIPVLRAAHDVGGRVWTGLIWCAALISAVVSARVFHPNVPQYSREPTIAANFLWTRHPAWDNPLPEIFAETLVGREERSVPVATAGCEKVLLSGRHSQGSWPVPCFPDVLPDECSTPGVLCYANRDRARYQFVRAPGSPIQLERFVYQQAWVWPAEAEPHLRQLFSQWEWWNLRPKTEGEDALRAARDVHVLELEGPGRLLFVLRRPGSQASLALRLPSRMAGALVDPVTGLTITNVHFDGQPFERWDLALPQAPELLLLSLSASGGS